MSGRFTVWISTTPAVTWMIKHVASRLDPLIFKATNGRLTSMGVPSMPMLTLTAIGRRSGQPRSVHLVCLEHGADHLVVASAMGQQRHPAWRYNFAARAQALTDSEKEAVWDGVRRAIPQMKVYEKRTDRNIRVYRLTRVGSRVADESMS